MADKRPDAASDSAGGGGGTSGAEAGAAGVARPPAAAAAAGVRSGGGDGSGGGGGGGRRETPGQLFAQYAPRVNLKSGFVYVAFMETDPDAAARVRDGLTGFEHLNDEVALGIGGRAASQFGIVHYLLSKAVQSFTAYFKYTHCEVAFPLSEHGKHEQGPDKLLAVYVNGVDNVSMRWRHFDARYRWFSLRATERQIESMLKFACLTRGEPFSAPLRNSVATTPGRERQLGWYCSKHVASLLRALDCEMFHLERTNTITVDELYHMVECSDHLVPQHNVSMPPVLLEQVWGQEAVADVLYKDYNRGNGGGGGKTGK